MELKRWPSKPASLVVMDVASVLATVDGVGLARNPNIIASKVNDTP